MLNKLLRKSATAFHLASLKLVKLSDTNKIGLEHKSIVASFAESNSTSIVITTFADRFHLSLPLIANIRNGGVTRPIYVLINADHGNIFDHDARTTFVSAISQYPSTFPITLGRKLGMSALWNTAIRCTGSEFVLLLNDDLSVHPSSLSQTIDKLFESVEQNGLTILNDSFSHFAISRKCISDVGWFDERFLGFGEEDGDYSWRYEDFYKRTPTNIRMNGLSSHSSDVGYEQIQSNDLNKYSLFNTAYLYKKYSFGNGGHKGTFGLEALKVIPEVDPYPLDHFYYEFSYCLDEASKDVVRSALDHFFGQ
jgi:glycosyltransferase involved in cell wall biosynthesis